MTLTLTYRCIDCLNVGNTYNLSEVYVGSYDRLHAFGLYSLLEEYSVSTYSVLISISENETIELRRAQREGLTYNSL